MESETKLTLKDMCPKNTFINLSNGKTYKIKAYSLYYKVQLIRKYGEDELVKQFSQVWRDDFIANLIFLLLDENGKKDFSNVDDFFKVVVTPADYASLFSAALQVVGYAEKILMSESEKKEFEAEKKTELK